MIKTFVIGPLSTNCYIFTDDKTGESVVVDPGYEANSLKTALDGLNVKYIFLTHAHADHMLGADMVRGITGAPIVCSEIDAKKLPSPQNTLYNDLDYVVPFKPVTADITVRDGDILKVGETVFTVMHTPGHTNGSVCYVTDDIIFSGDTVFYMSSGRTDFETGSLFDMIASFKRLFALPGDREIFTGHDEQTSLEFERKHNYLSGYIDNH